MKGAVFIALNEFIEEQYGIELWEKLLDDVKPKCEGIFTSTEDYPDEEVRKFIAAISSRTELSPEDVTRIFGRFLFDELNKKFPIFTKISSDLFSFLESIENVIHKEVRKLYDNTSLPLITPLRRSDTVLELEYSSPRKLCLLAEGLVEGAAAHFGERIQLSHPRCMHRGAASCLLVVEKL